LSELKLVTDNLLTTLAIDLGFHGSWQIFICNIDYQSIIETLQLKILPTTMKSKIYHQRRICNTQ